MKQYHLEMCEDQMRNLWSALEESLCDAEYDIEQYEETGLSRKYCIDVRADRFELLLMVEKYFPDLKIKRLSQERLKNGT